MAKIEAPNKDYNGPGPGDAKFKDGVAHTDDEAAINYYRGAGYTVDGDSPDDDDTPEPPDPRDIEDEIVGTRLRDAAVDPQSEDFLAPINAGKANPHGPQVISPEIHGSGPKGIRPGGVPVDDHGKQEEREKEFAKARLLENQPAADANASVVPDPEERGELDISDPGSVEAGKQAAQEQSTDESSQPAKKTAAKKSTAKKS